ncbi:MAG: hypothetical protein EZS28_027696, partial [Streblomastix strix]
MSDGDLHMLDAVLKHDETLFGSIRYNTVGLVDQVIYINNQINMINNVPAPDVYTRPEVNELLNEKADKTDLDDYYTKSETYAKVEVYNKTEVDEFFEEKANVGTSYTRSEDDALLLLKADKTQLIDSYSKSEDDALLLLKADKTDFDEYYTAGQVDELLDEKADKTQLIDSYSKSEDDALLLLKTDKTQLIDSYSKSEADELLDEKADKIEFDEYYIAGQVDTLLDEKADKTQQIDSYSKSEDDALLLLKADKTQLIDSYSKSEDDALLLLKADKTQLIDSYSKSEDDALLLLKADKTALNNFVDLTSTQIISGQKQFGIISVASVAKQDKDDESILLAGGGDMLVSTLVNQTELQEVRDIAQGKSKGYVFSTQEELNDWMAIQDNVANLAIGDNLYIVDKEVTDYWWDGTDLKVLETELPDMSNVVTTLGAATGSGNAITDISIDGNAITPAKNTTFVTTGFDQSITGMKIFTSTIISNGIQYSGYDNNSVFLAGGGVRAISDINATNTGVSYTKDEDDELLLAKVDKTQLIDSYTKTETDKLLNNKANTGVSYTKGEDDTLLFAKADKTQLIDAYSKSEDDALLLLKADKTQLIDAYTKTETNNLLNNKTDTGVSYTKGEDDTLLFAKVDKTQLIDAYTKTQTDNLLNDKANQSTTYTKIEIDQLISQIDTGDVDLSSYYTKTKTDELLDEKVNTTDLSNYMTLGTSQTITANKTFNNACRFVSTIDGMSTVTGASFVKSGADDTVVLLGACGTKPIAEFISAPTDLSNYYTKTQTYAKEEVYSRNDTYSQTQTNSLINNKTSDSIPGNDSAFGSAGILSLFARSDHRHILNVAPGIDIQPCVNGVASKASGFIKSGKDDTSVLLAGGGDRLLSSFGGVQVEDITDLIVNLHSNITFNYLKLTRIGTFYTLMMEIMPKTQIAISTQTTICTVGSMSNTITPPTPPSTIYPISLATKRKTLTCVYSYRDFKISTDSTEAWVYIDEKLLNAAGLMDFPELYAYIKERNPQSSIGESSPVPVGEQTLQKQVKDNDDIPNNSNEEFVPPVANAPTKLDLSSQLERSSFLASIVDDPKLIPLVIIPPTDPSAGVSKFAV